MATDRSTGLAESIASSRTVANSESTSSSPPSPPGGAGADDVVHRRPAGVAPDGRAAVGDFGIPMSSSNGSSCGRARVVEQPAGAGWPRRERPVGGGTGRGIADYASGCRADCRRSSPRRPHPTRYACRSREHPDVRHPRPLGCLRRGHRSRRHLRRALRRRPAAVRTDDGAPSGRPLARRRWRRGVVDRTRRRRRRSWPSCRCQGRRRRRAASRTSPRVCESLPPERPYVLVVDNVDRYDDGGAVRAVRAHRQVGEQPIDRCSRHPQSQRLHQNLVLSEIRRNRHCSCSTRSRRPT